MIINLKNKKALVTGGGTGIGQFIVKALENSGASVAFTSRSNKSLKETSKLLKFKKKHFAYRTDLTKKGSVKKLYKVVKKKVRKYRYFD